MDVNKISNLFKFISINTSDKDIKNMKEANLFLEQNGQTVFNSNLLKHDDFVDTFLSSTDDSLSEKELSFIYHAISEIDGQEGMSKADLTLLAAMGNKTDANDKDGNLINEKDILAFLATVDEQIEAAKNPTTPSTPAKPATPTTTTTTETVDKKPTTMEETKTEIIDGNQVTTHVKYEEDKVKQEIMKEEKQYETVKVKEQVPFEKDSRIKSDSKGKYVTVEPWGSKKGANDCLERIITNSYDLDKMGIKVYNKDGSYTKEFKALEKAVMDANPSIYGDKNGKGGHKDHPDLDGTRHNKIIYTGDKIYLPKYSIETGETEKKLVGTKKVPTGEYEYVSKNPPTWTKTTTITTVPLQDEPEPTPGPAGKDGEDGVGIDKIELKDGKFIFTMTDGTTKEVDASSLQGADGKDGKDGKDGLGIADIKTEGNKMIFIMSDGTKKEVELPAGSGENGKSAYELAVEAGFEGTLEEWLDSINGKDGISVEKTWVGDDEHLYVQMSDGKVLDAGDVIKTELEQAIEEGIVAEGTTYREWLEFKTLTIKVDPEDGNAYFWQFGEWVTENGERVRADGEDGKHVIYDANGGTEVTPDDPTLK